jgi:hypothetical protein
VTSGRSTVELQETPETLGEKIIAFPSETALVECAWRVTAEGREETPPTRSPQSCSVTNEIECMDRRHRVAGGNDQPRLHRRPAVEVAADALGGPGRAGKEFVHCPDLLAVVE